MSDLSVKYMGLELCSPVIAGSSGLTRQIDNLKELERQGAGAIVLKSLFEEQIRFEIRKVFSYDDVQSGYTEAEDYIRNYARTHTVNEYLELIQQAKKAVSIPIIASVNCVSSHEWPSFAAEIENAGADALELNVFVLPADAQTEGSEYEKIYFDVAEAVLKQTKLPVSIKISSHFSGLASMVKKLSWTGIKGLVLFNRFFNPDIDVEKLKIVSSNLYSSPEEITNSLRWIAVMSGRTQADLCASTGVHSGEAVVKQLLAGASAVQVCSVLYKNGLEQMGRIHEELKAWMVRHGHKNIDSFRGKMSHKNLKSPAAYHRVQFMKHFAGID